MSTTTLPSAPPAGRRRRLRTLTALAAVLLLAAVAAVLWWRPWRTVTLPAHACWGVLTAGDLRPLAGPDGTMTAATNTSTLQPATQATNGGYLCPLSWQGGQTPHYLGGGPKIALYTAAELRRARAADASRGAVRSLSLGPGNIAWQAAGDYSLSLAVPCTFRDPFSGQSADGYARVSIDATPSPRGYPAPPGEVRQADAQIVLKLAKAFVEQYPCTAARLPASTPSIPAYPGS
jgi:hypothetical protein